MPNLVHSFDEPERFVVGTVGSPGQRTFFLQARDGGRVVSVALEKQQVAVLAERLDLLLDEALRQLGGEAGIPAVAPTRLLDRDPLEQPIDEDFRVGTITLGWDADAGRVVIELFSVTDEAGSADGDDAESDVTASELSSDDEDDDEPEADEVVVVRLDPGYARSFVQRAQSVVSAGRPTCQFCGGPVDADGHLCPRANGFRRTQA